MFAAAYEKVHLPLEGDDVVRESDVHNVFTMEIDYELNSIFAKAAAAKAATTPAAKPAAKAATCTSGSLRNPATGRCVKETGAIGRKLLSATRRRTQ